MYCECGRARGGAAEKEALLGARRRASPCRCGTGEHSPSNSIKSSAQQPVSLLLLRFAVERAMGEGVVMVLLRGEGKSCTKPTCCSASPGLRTRAAMRDSEADRTPTSMSHLRRSSCKAARYEVRASVCSRGTCLHVEMQPLGLASSLDVEHDVQLGFGSCSRRSPHSHFTNPASIRSRAPGR